MRDRQLNSKNRCQSGNFVGVSAGFRGDVSGFRPTESAQFETVTKLLSTAHLIAVQFPDCRQARAGARISLLERTQRQSLLSDIFKVQVFLTENPRKHYGSGLRLRL